MKSKLLMLILPFKTRSLSRKLSLSLSAALILVGGTALIFYTMLSVYQAKLDMDVKSTEYLNAMNDTLILPLWDVDENKIIAICKAYAKNDFIGQIKVTRTDGYVYFNLTKPGLTIIRKETKAIVHNEETVGILILGLTTDYYNMLYWRFFLFYTSSIFMMILGLSLTTHILLRKYLKTPLTQFAGMTETYALGNKDAFQNQDFYVEFDPFINVMKEMGNTINQQLKSLKLTQHAIDKNIIPTYWVSQEGNIIYSNDAACRTSGYTHAGFFKLSITDIFPDGLICDQPGKINDFASFESVQHNKDGTSFPVEITANYLKYDHEDYIFAFVTDIRERKKAQEDIHRQKHLFETMFDTIPDGVVIADTHRKIQLVNKGMKIIFGYKEEELLGKSSGILYPDEEKYHQAGARVFQRDSEKAEDMYITDYWDKDGRKFSGETFGAKLFDADENWIGNLGIIRDITDRIEADRQLRQTQKMESIGSLAGGIAHDFNNILSSIIGFTDLALEDTKNLQADNIEKKLLIEDSLQEVHTAGKRAKELVKQILAFARQSEEDFMPVQIDKIVEEVIKFIRSSIPTTIEISSNLLSNSLIMGNQTQIHQIMMNLCTNAAHSMDESGGNLTVSLEDTIIDKNTDSQNLDLKHGDYVKLIISDTGTGINPNIINSIFDPYFTTKKPGEGTGMGLAMVHGIVESYDGKISVKSRLGRGSTFSIYLPVVHKRQVKTQAKFTEWPTGTEKILFVDDEVSIAKMSKKTLEKLGYKVTTKTSSIEALELFRSKTDDFDLVITDMTMPNMTGAVLATELMALRNDIPVILCTGYSNKISDAKAAEIDIKAFIGKPVTVEQMATTVRRVLDGINKPLS